MFRWCIILALALSGCRAQLPTYRYRLTVEVETPTGLKRGSSVIEVANWDNGKGFPGPEAGGFRSKVRGEAVAVEVAPNQVLFALLNRADGIAFAALPLMRPDDNVEDRIDALLGVMHATPLVQTEYPMLVYFRDIRKPDTVEAVDPNNLVKNFGSGVKLRRITIQLTEDSVTKGIDDRLRWLGEHPEPSLNPRHGLKDFTLPATLHHGDFVRR